MVQQALEWHEHSEKLRVLGCTVFFGSNLSRLEPYRSTSKRRDASQVGFRGRMLLVGASYFYWANVGRIVLPDWTIWAHLFYSACYHASELRKEACRMPVLLPDALLRRAIVAVPHLPSKSCFCPLPHVLFLDLRRVFLHESLRVCLPNSRQQQPLQISKLPITSPSLSF